MTAIEVAVLGSGPAAPRPGGACAGFLLRTGSEGMLVDCGHGVVGRLEEAIPLDRLRGVLISHMHPDHYFDLVALKYALLWRDLRDVPLYLPPGGADVLSRLQQAVLDSGDFFGQVFRVSEYDPRGSVALDGLTVRFERTDHPVPAFAMRFTPPGSSGDLAYTADTAWSPAVVELLRGASLAIVESTYTQYPGPDSHGHLTAALAGDMAREAGVERLLLTHYGADGAETARDDAAAHFQGPVDLAVEGKTYPVGGAG